MHGSLRASCPFGPKRGGLGVLGLEAVVTLGTMGAVGATGGGWHEPRWQSGEERRQREQSMVVARDVWPVAGAWAVPWAAMAGAAAAKMWATGAIE